VFHDPRIVSAPSSVHLSLLENDQIPQTLRIDVPTDCMEVLYSIPEKEVPMDLGAFSVSLAVSDIEVSRDFYKKLGFEVFHGDVGEKWLIMKNGSHVIGLFEGMFEKNILTFNPGWDSDAQDLPTFTDVREIQRRLKAEGLSLIKEADEMSVGPASCTLVDPDGNPILIDQHR
jgi:lactoylglutathione lyase